MSTKITKKSTKKNLSADVPALITSMKTAFSPAFEEFWFPIQASYVHTVLTCPESVIVLKACRQSFKSFITSLIAAVYIVTGHRVVVATPKMAQATDVLLFNTSMFLEAYRKNKGKTASDFYLEENVRKKVLREYGGSLIAVSTGSERIDGLTADLVILDEAQDVDSEVVRVRIMPFIDVAARQAKTQNKPHLGKIIVLGRGGLPTSFIEQTSSITGVLLLKYTADDIIAQYPEFKISLDNSRYNMSEAEFMTNYYCEPIPSDARLIFPNVLVQSFSRPEGPEMGIDWGRSDLTVGCAAHEENGVFYIHSLHVAKGKTYENFSQSLMEWIDTYRFKREKIRVERNAVGDAALEILERAFRDVLKIRLDLRKSSHFLTAKSKHKAMQYLITKSEQGKLIVENDQIKEKIKNLVYKYVDTADGVLIDAEHSDYLSAIILATPGIVREVGMFRRN